MKRKRKESCPSPILDDSPKRTKVQAQRKFAQNSGMHSPIMSPIRDLETADLLPNASVVPDPVELLPMKRPNTEDFLTFLCFRGTPILPPNLQFFNAASIVTDGQVHEIKGDSPKNGPIDISKCAGAAGTSSDKPFIAFGVRKRADPIVISRQMERKRRHALAIQALRRKYQEQKMAKIRALTISKLSEKTTNKTLVKTNTIQKTETVTKKTNMLQKTKVIATKHVKVTTQTLKTKVKPKMCLRNLRGKAVQQKELPFRNRRALQERENAKKLAKSVVRTSKNSNKAEGTLVKKKIKPITANVSSKPVKRIADVKKTIKVSSSARVTRSGSVTTVVRKPNVSAKSKLSQVKRRILLPTTTTVGVLKPKLRSTTTKKTVISRKKAKQRTKPNKSPATETGGKKEKDTFKKVQEKESVKKVQEKETTKNASEEGALKSPPDNSKRVTRKDSEMALKNVPDKGGEKGEVKKEVTKSLDLKKEVRIAETTASKEVKKNVNLKKEYRLKSTSKDVKKNVDLKKTSSTISEKNEVGQKVKRDVKTLEMTVKKVVTKKSDGGKQNEPNSTEEKIKESRRSSRSTTQEEKEEPNKKSPRHINKSSKAVEKKEIIEAANAKRTAQAAASAKKSPVRNPKKKQQEKTDVGCVKPPAVVPDKEIKPLESSPIVEKKEPVESITEKKQQRKEPSTKHVPKEISPAEADVKKEEDKKEVLNEKAEVKKPIVEEVKSKTVGIVSSVKKVTKKEVSAKSISDDSKEIIETKKLSVIKPIKNALKGTLKIKKKVKDTQVTPAKSNIEMATSKVLEAAVQLAVTEKPPKSTEKSLATNVLPMSDDKPSSEKIKESISKDDKSASKKSNKKTADKGGSCKEATKSNIIKPETANEPLSIPIKSAEKEIITPKKVIKESVAKNPPKKEGTSNALTDSELDKKNSKEQLVESKKKDLSAKNIVKEEVPKRKSTPKREEPEQVVQKASPRPSRKTKEAAAIYMEILSHKLVNDSIIDDDNVSIDSFPELPNVKKTEQREIELKAQAKTSKDEDSNSVCVVVDDKKSKRVSKMKKDASEGVDDVKHETGSLDIELKVLTKCAEVKSPLLNKDKGKIRSQDVVEKSSLGKRKSNSMTQVSDSDSDNEVLLAKIRKSEAQKNLTRDGLGDKREKIEEKQNEVAKIPGETAGDPHAKRQTRRATQTVKDSDGGDSSDESFHVDVRVPKKKKNTRSQNKSGSLASVSVLEKNVDIILEAARVLESENILELKKNESPADVDTAKVEEQPVKPLIKDQPEKLKVVKKSEISIKDLKKNKNCPDASDSDESTTSDINLKSLQARQRNKKLSKTKSTTKSSAASFSDSDEEPLSKLTGKVAATVFEDVKKKPSKPKTTSKKMIADKNNPTEPAIIEPKPKRECTKRPSNYLPMLSSSDEENEPYFHGFNTTIKEATTNEPPETFVQTLAPSLEFLNKDIGRKGKVNMSNEQIEQWLKDSALAGSSVARENDEMLKFGEKIPVENSSTAVAIELKLSSETTTREVKTLVACPLGGDKTPRPEDRPVPELKSPLADRKWIFKKDKKEQAPNKNAFSPENECSVYAFGEENEELISTPFRRPSRRPSSTATSRSEDELSKNDDSVKQGQFRKPGLLPSDSEDSRCFPIPQNPTKHLKTAKTESMVPPSTTCPSKRATKPTPDRFPEPFDDFKYKIPSSPSASSGSSAKPYKKGAQKQKGKVWEAIAPVYVSDFPKQTDLPKMVEAPVFHPTDQEFQDPLEYIERIRHKAEQFGICKIVPPTSFKPECKVSDDMRFTAYNQYVHKMLHRWGPNFKEFMVIKKYLATQNIPLKSPPLIGGMEIDLPRLYQTVQSLGGLKEVIEKKKWSKVSDHMKIPKLAQDRVTKLDDIYCKYLLPYDTLSPAEREKLFDEVETNWAKRESKNMQLKSEAKAAAAEVKPPPDDVSEHDDYESDDNETEECTVKSKTMALNAFYRIARNTMSMYFKVAEPTAQEVEQEFWRYVIQKQNHICVHSASIDCGSWGYGFAVSKNSPFARHPWNLKAMSNNSGSVLRSLGPVMGVTIPTLHVGMVFSTCCWYRDPHGLPWVEYLHTGGSKIWYGIPSASCDVFQAAMRKLVPNYCRDKELWLPSDTAMVPPGLLMEHNVSLCRTVQEPGQFLVVFPKVYTSSISTGYVVSESVYFAPLYWLRTARNLFDGLKNSCEPSMFSLDKLLMSIAMDARSSVEVLRVIIPFIEEIYTRERDNRVRFRNFGKIEEEKITNSEISSKKKKMQNVEDFECEVCRTNLYISMAIDTQEDLIYCLEHAIELVAKNSQMVERFKLRYAFEESELQTVPAKIRAAIETKLQKKVPSKYAGLPTMLK